MIFAALPFLMYWQLPVVLVLISLVYSATRHDDWRLIFWETLRWARNMIVFLGLIGVALYIVSLFTR